MATATQEQQPVVEVARETVTQIGSLRNEAREKINGRLNELKEEEKSLREMLSEIGPQPVEAPASAPSPEQPPRRRRRRRNGTRADQAMKVIEDHPGSSATEIADFLGVKPNYMYRVMAELVKEGRVKKDGSKYQPV